MPIAMLQTVYQATKIFKNSASQNPKPSKITSRKLVYLGLQAKNSIFNYLIKQWTHCYLSFVCLFETTFYNQEAVCLKKPSDWSIQERKIDWHWGKNKLELAYHWHNKKKKISCLHKEDDNAARFDKSLDIREDMESVEKNEVEEVEGREDSTVSYFLHRSYLQPQSLRLCLPLMLQFSLSLSVAEKLGGPLCCGEISVYITLQVEMMWCNYCEIHTGN